jgi:hypothetical protein
MIREDIENGKKFIHLMKYIWIKLGW